jgi:FMN phosphatase YigB (HAD superfamily)
LFTKQVVSPFQAILDYELSIGVPPGWVNFCISRNAPNGAFHRLERGEIKMDKTFFDGFNADFRNDKLWLEYCAKLKERYPDKFAHLTSAPPIPVIDGEALFWEMMRVSRTPDPYMFPVLQKLRASGKYLVAALSNTVIFPPGHPYAKETENIMYSAFDVFVSSAHVGLRKPDPEIYHLAVKMMDSYAKENAVGKGKGLGWEHGVTAKDVVFLDDIGTNLKTARQIGMGTIKVNLGKTKDAVKELEKILGESLLDDNVKSSL